MRYVIASSVGLMTSGVDVLAPRDWTNKRKEVGREMVRVPFSERGVVAFQDRWAAGDQTKEFFRARDFFSGWPYHLHLSLTLKGQSMEDDVDELRSQLNDTNGIDQDPDPFAEGQVILVWFRLEVVELDSNSMLNQFELERHADTVLHVVPWSFADGLLLDLRMVSFRDVGLLCFFEFDNRHIHETPRENIEKVD